MTLLHEEQVSKGSGLKFPSGKCKNVLNSKEQTTTKGREEKKKTEKEVRDNLMAITTTLWSPSSINETVPAYVRRFMKMTSIFPVSQISTIHSQFKGGPQIWKPKKAKFNTKQSPGKKGVCLASKISWAHAIYKVQDQWVMDLIYILFCSKQLIQLS